MLCINVLLMCIRIKENVLRTLGFILNISQAVSDNNTLIIIKTLDVAEICHCLAP